MTLGARPHRPRLPFAPRPPLVRGGRVEPVGTERQRLAEAVGLT